MADLPISKLTAITGASVDVDNDKLAIVDHSATETKYITPKELIANSTTFIAAGVAADVSPRSLQARAREVVTITDYKNTDGTQVATTVADNGTGIAKAITAVTTNGGLVFTPAGTFGHSTSQTIPANVGLLGQGQNASIWDYTGAGVGVTTAASGSYFSTQGMRLTTSTGTTNFRVQGTASWVTCTDTAFVGGTTTGVYLTNTANNIKFVTCTMTNCGATGTADSGGILVDGNANGVGIVSCNINSNDGWGIRVTNTCRGWSLTGGTVVEGNLLGGMYAKGITGLSINGTYWENTAASKYQIFLENNGATLNLGVDIRGNIFGCAATFDCLALQSITGLTVEGNEFRATRYAIDGSGGSLTNYRIANNQVLAGANLFWNGTDASDAQVITDVPQTHRAGTGDGTATRTGRITVGTTTVGTDANTSAKTLQSASIPANTLSANGMGLHGVAYGTFAATATNKRVDWNLGGQTVSAASAVYNNLNWKIECWIYRTGAATEKSIGVSTINGVSPIVDYLTQTVSLTADTTLSVIGTNGTGNLNDIVCEGFYVELME